MGSCLGEAVDGRLWGWQDAIFCCLQRNRTFSLNDNSGQTELDGMHSLTLEAQHYGSCKENGTNFALVFTSPADRLRNANASVVYCLETASVGPIGLVASD